MDLGQINRALAYANDILQVGVDMCKRDGTSLSERMQKAGNNLIWNSMTTRAADNIYNHTGCTNGYLAKYTSGSANPQASLYNTMQAGIYSDMMYNGHTPWSGSLWNYNTCCGGRMSYGMSSGLSIPMTYGSMDSRFDVFDNNSFFRRW